MLPRYGSGTLADVVPSLLAALGVAGFDGVLRVEPARAVCLLLVDGLGDQLLRAHGRYAPFLAGLAAGAEPITVGFPSTTATSIASVGTGRPPGEHGILGYTFATPHDELLNALTWCAGGTDARERFVPELAQPHPTALQRAAADGVAVRLAVPAWFRGTGLTRAALRGGEIAGTHAMGDVAAVALSALAGGGRSFCYAYHGGLDTVGHVHGPGSLAWRLELAQVDLLASAIAEGLPAGGLLAVVADHGMVATPPADRVDVDAEPYLLDGVRLLGGDPRARHVYTTPGAEADVLVAWRARLGDRALVVPRDEAVAAGWFGPVVTRDALARIGDVLAVATGTTAIVRSEVEPRETAMLGGHGALTAAEQLVPWLVSGKAA